jgi:hypothetical protein
MGSKAILVPVSRPCSPAALRGARRGAEDYRVRAVVLDSPLSAIEMRNATGPFSAALARGVISMDHLLSGRSQAGHVTNPNARLDLSKSVLCQRRVVKPEANLLHMCRLRALRTFHRTERSRRLFQRRLETRMTQDPTASERTSESPVACGPTSPSRSTKDAARRRLFPHQP